MREQLLLQQGARALGLALTTSQLEAFVRLEEALLAWNRRVNLTGISDPSEIEVKHFVDSLTLVPLLSGWLSSGQGSCIDVGSGAGFPGLPLAIAMPGLRLTLVEATGKKIAFLRQVVAVLGLERVTTVYGRAEQLAHAPEHRGAYDVAVARALSGAATLVELLVPFHRVGGHAVLMKKRSDAESQVAAAAAALAAMDAAVEEIVPVEIPGLLEDRALVVIEKRGPTSDRFPRRPGVPQRRPL